MISKYLYIPVSVLAIVLLLVAFFSSSVLAGSSNQSTRLLSSSSQVQTTTTSTENQSVVSATSSQMNCLIRLLNSSVWNYTPTLKVGINGDPGYLCVRFYYYNANQTLQLDPLAHIFIKGYSISGGVGNSFDATNKFSISASPSSVEIGGPSNENEGVTVIYSIFGGNGSNGSYNIQLAPRGPVNTSLGLGLVSCNEDILLIVGTGSPNYSTYGAGCIVRFTSTIPVNIVYDDILVVRNAT